MRHLIESFEPRRLLADTFSASINFAPISAHRAPGLLADYGAAYGVRRGGLSYGWSADATANAVERDLTKVQKNDTFVAMQAGGNKAWSIGVPNGTYTVYVVGGDPGATGDRMAITVEGELAVSGVTKRARRYLEGGVTVAVTDGRITVDSAPWAVANKICYLAVSGTPTTPIPTPPVTPPAAAPTSLAWTTRAARPLAASEMFGNAVGDTLYTFGGFVDSTYHPTRSVYAYDVTTNTWGRKHDLPIGMTNAASVADGASVYIAGGYPGSGTGGAQTFSTTAVYRYDVASDSYATLPSLPVARGVATMARVGRVLYFVGGADSQRHDVSTVYALNLDNLAAGWVTRASLPAARNHLESVALDGYVYAFAGQTGVDAGLTTHPDAYRYDPNTNAWTTIASLPGGRSHVTASAVVGGHIVAVAGQSAHEMPIASVVQYDPATNRWTTLTALPAARFSGLGDYLGGKFVYAAGYNGAFKNTTYVGTFA